MRIIGITPTGQAVQFEADAQPVDPATAALAHGASAAIGASSGAIMTLRLDSGGASGKSGNASAGAATLNKASGIVTTEALATAAGAEYTLTVTNSTVTANDMVMASIQNGTNSAGAPIVRTVAPANGSLVIVLRNDHASAALNGTVKVTFIIFKT